MLMMIRTIILFVLALISIRLMGKRQIGELQPYEFIVTMIVSELAVLPMENPGVPLIYGVIPLMTVLALQLAISIISLKNVTFREFLCGRPSILVHNGKLNVPNMQEELITTTDLMSQLRCAGVENLCDLKWAIMESNGKVNIYTTPAYPTELIIDGEIIEESLAIFNKDRHWLEKRLESHGIKSAQEVFICTMEPDGSLFVQRKEGKT